MALLRFVKSDIYILFICFLYFPWKVFCLIFPKSFSVPMNLNGIIRRTCQHIGPLWTSISATCENKHLSQICNHFDLKIGLNYFFICRTGNHFLFTKKLNRQIWQLNISQSKVVVIRNSFGFFVMIKGLRLWCKCVIPVGQYDVKTDRILSLIRFHNIATFLAKENSSRCRMAWKFCTGF